MYTPLYYAGQLELGLLAVEAALEAPRGARGDTCGVAAARGDADGCAFDAAFDADVDAARLRAPWEAHARGEL